MSSQTSKHKKRHRKSDDGEHRKDKKKKKSESGASTSKSSRKSEKMGSSISKAFGGLPLAADGSIESGLQDFSDLTLKPGHQMKPLLVCPNGTIFLELCHEVSKQASDFLITIAEPMSRPELIHEYQLTVFSLYGAVSVGVGVEEILKHLCTLSKNEIPKQLEATLRQNAEAFGRVKLVLRGGRHFVEATSQEDLNYMLTSRTFKESRIRNSLTSRRIEVQSKGRAVSDAPITIEDAPTLDPSVLAFKLTSAAAETHTAMTEPTTKEVYSFEVSTESLSRIREAALTELHRPLLLEYDFRRDSANPTLDISLRPATKIRYYQERSLRKMFSNGRARSGMIVLPCGAGKTLTGITAITTIRRSAMVLTSSAVAVDQWKRAVAEFSTLDASRVITLTSEAKKDLPVGACVVISTYTMMSYSGKRSEAAERIMTQIRQREWGLLIFDEVQFAPAPAFRRVNDIVKSHCKLGLTATLVREDDLINDLQWLIGPKLYEANWLELQEAGFLAKVQCSEVWCPMTAEYFRAYLGGSHAKQRKLWVCNPNKLQVCEYLVSFHENRNDKIIVFSDNLFALQRVARLLKKPFISGEVGIQERMLIISKFKSDPNFNTVFLSKVGDNAIDIPCANVVIQISFNFASRRQEAQRLGRILRPKPQADEEFNAFFYSLVSKDTQEMVYSDKRQQFIIDQGYAYKVLPMSVFPMEPKHLVLGDKALHESMLREILASVDTTQDLEEDDVVLSGSPEPEAVAAAITLAQLSGGGEGGLYRDTERLRIGR